MSSDALNGGAARSLRIFVLSTWCPYPTVNGSTLRFYHLLRALASRHAVDLAAFAAPAAPDAAAVAHLREFCADVTVIPRSPFTPLRRAPGGLLRMTPRSLVETDDPEVRALVADRLRACDLAVGFALAAARYLGGAPVPAVFEEAEPRQIANQIDDAPTTARRLRRRFTWWKHARYLSRLARGMAAVTVVSEPERSTLRAIGVPDDRIHLVMNGAERADLMRPRTIASPRRLIYTGALSYAPNREAVAWFLQHVMPRVHAARPEVEFWVTGDLGDTRVDQLPNARLARFTGRLPEVKAAVGDAAAAVVPLLTGGGTRLKVLEALALGTPVVSTTKGVEGLDVVDGEHALVADAADAFAAQVLRLFYDDTLAGRLSAAGRALVAARYTWDAAGAQLLRVVDGVAEGARR